MFDQLTQHSLRKLQSITCKIIFIDYIVSSFIKILNKKNYQINLKDAN